MSTDPDFSQLHDGELCAWRFFNTTSELDLEVRLSQSEDVCLIRLQGVIAFRISDVFAQNVISRVFFAPSGREGAEQVRQYVCWMNTLTEGGVLITDSGMQEYVQKILDGTLRLFVMEPSWGAEGVVLFNKDVVFTKT